MILLDTHVAFWLESDAARISQKATAAIKHARDDGSGLAISDFSLLELAILIVKGRIRLRVSVQSFLDELEKDFRVLPITSGACALIGSFPSSFPNDPADRVIAATAITEGLPLVTADRQIRAAKVVDTIW